MRCNTNRNEEKKIAGGVVGSHSHSRSLALTVAATRSGGGASAVCACFTVAAE